VTRPVTSKGWKRRSGCAWSGVSGASTSEGASTCDCGREQGDARQVYARIAMASGSAPRALHRGTARTPSYLRRAAVACRTAAKHGLLERRRGRSEGVIEASAWASGQRLVFWYCRRETRARRPRPAPIKPFGAGPVETSEHARYRRSETPLTCGVRIDPSSTFTGLVLCSESTSGANICDRVR